MIAKVALVILTHLAWQPSCTPNKSDLVSLLPDLSMLCPDVDFCGMDPEINRNVTTKNNPCCQGCSCHDNCTEKDNCCFAEERNRTSMVQCLVPGTTQEIRNAPKYRFVVEGPATGCVESDSSDKQGNVTCSPNEKVAPWGNFFPVYSKTADRNFKNAPCARCHGVVDTVEWSAIFEYIGSVSELAHSWTLFDEQGIFLYSYILFSPPNAESKSSDKLCFEEIGTCAEVFRDKYYIPSKLQMDRDSIVKACETGPRAMYIRRFNRAYKNIFCALCNGAATEFADALRCEFNPDQARFTDSPYRSLLDGKYVKAAIQNKVRDRKREKYCLEQKHEKNDSNCHQSYCPSLQTRLQTGYCGYATKLVKVDCINLCLNLSTNQGSEEDKKRLLSMSDTQIHAILEQGSPWSDAFSIYSIAYLEGSNRTEFFVCMLLKRNEINLRSLIGYIQKQLSKTWSLNIRQKLGFRQNINRHGKITLDKDKYLVTTLWSRYHYPVNESLFIPRWRRIYEPFEMRPSRFCLAVSKMMMCEQVQLLPDEYQLANSYSILYLTKEDRVLYPNEYTALVDKDGSLRVRICLEDSGYVKKENKASSVGIIKATMTIIIIVSIVELQLRGV